MAEELREDVERIVKSSAGSWRRVLDEVAAWSVSSGLAASVVTAADLGRLPMVLRGLPTWDGLRTPPSREDAELGPQPPDLIPLTVMAGLGVPLAFAVTQHGRVVQDVVASDASVAPQPDAVGRAVEMHTEAGFARFKPDHVGLYCVYNDDCVGTILSVLEPDLIPSDVARLLSTVRPSAVLAMGSSDQLDPASTLVEGAEGGRPGGFGVSFDLGYFAFDLTEEQQAALDALTQIVEDQSRRVVLGPGEMVIWDNHTTIHGRDRYPLHYNGRDRWLKRVYTRREIASCEDLLVDGSLNVFP